MSSEVTLFSGKIREIEIHTPLTDEEAKNLAILLIYIPTSQFAELIRRAFVKNCNLCELYEPEAEGEPQSVNGICCTGLKLFQVTSIHMVLRAVMHLDDSIESAEVILSSYNAACNVAFEND